MKIYLASAAVVTIPCVMQGRRRLLKSSVNGRIHAMVHRACHGRGNVTLPLIVGLVLATTWSRWLALDLL